MEAVLLLLVAQAAPVAREVAHLTMPRRLVTTRLVDATSGMILLCETVGHRLEQRLNHQIPVIPDGTPLRLIERRPACARC